VFVLGFNQALRMSVNTDLANERRKAKFDVERLSRVLYGSFLNQKRKVGKSMVTAEDYFELKS